MLHFHIQEVFKGGKVYAVFDDEPAPRAWLLSGFLNDMYGQEDVYLAELAKAEAGEPTDIYNHEVKAYLYPDYVVLEDFTDPYPEEAVVEGPPNCTRLSLAETKQLILDWVEAKKRWYAQNDKASRVLAGSDA